MSNTHGPGSALFLLHLFLLVSWCPLAGLSPILPPLAPSNIHLFVCLFILCVCVCLYRCEKGDNRATCSGSEFFHFPRVLGNQTQVARLRGIHLYLLAISPASDLLEAQLLSLALFPRAQLRSHLLQEASLDFLVHLPTPLWQDCAYQETHDLELIFIATGWGVCVCFSSEFVTSIHCDLVLTGLFLSSDKNVEGKAWQSEGLQSSTGGPVAHQSECCGFYDSKHSRCRNLSLYS